MADSIKRLAEEARAPQERFTDLRVQWCVQNAEGVVPVDAAPMFDAGGVWDRLSKRWDDERQARAIRLELHEGQVAAARWFVAWLTARARGETLREDGQSIYTCMLSGGRRAGKSDLAAKVALTFAMMAPGSFVWLVSENQAKTEELEVVVRSLLPSSTYAYRGAPKHRLDLPNGSTIWLRSAHDPEQLRRGRCDLAVLNEAQNMPEDVFAIVRPATTDRAGLTIMTCNPWRYARGQWTERFREEVDARKRPGRAFTLDATLNPHIDHESMASLKGELDERTYAAEIEGRQLPSLLAVFHAWSTSRDGNVRELPGTDDVTRMISKLKLGREFDFLIGCDFQKNPHPCAVIFKAFANPDGGEPLLYMIDYIVVPQGDEEGLSNALRDAGYDPERCALICDASGAWQAIDRTKKESGSYTLLRQYGWTHIFTPDDQYKSNPPILERIKATNALMKSADGRRRLFSLPENLALNDAIKLWENRLGIPSRRSQYAHLGDALSYVCWRLYPRREEKKRSAPPRKEHMIAVTPPKPWRII